MPRLELVESGSCPLLRPGRGRVRLALLPEHITVSARTRTRRRCVRDVGCTGSRVPSARASHSTDSYLISNACEKLSLFCRALQDWAVNGDSKFVYRVIKSDRQRNHIVCVHEECPFRVYAPYQPTRECVIVGSHDEHNCVSAISRQSSQCWLQCIQLIPVKIIDAVGLRAFPTPSAMPSPIEP